MRVWVFASAFFVAATTCYAGDNDKNNDQPEPGVSFTLPGNYSLGFETSAPNSGSHRDNAIDPRKDPVGFDASLHEDNVPNPSGVLAPKRETRPFLGLKLSTPLSQ